MTYRSTRPRAFIIHGYAATPEDHWFGWLADRLEAVGIPASVPAMPESLAPDPQRWEGTLRDTIGVPDENMILVAHSLGALTALRHLASQSEPWRLGTLVLIAGFLDRLPALPELDAYIGDGCDVGQIAHRVNRLAVFRSDDDAFVPAGHTDRLADLLGTTAQVVPGAGHFLAEEGVTTLPPVLKAIEPDIPPSLTAD